MSAMREQPRLASRSFMIEVTIAGLMIFVLSVTIGIVTNADSGSVADWLAAISTLAAFVAAVIAARYAAQAVERERLRDERRDDSERRSEAASVAAWLNEMQYYLTASKVRFISVGAEMVQDPAVAGFIPREIHVTVRNLSPFPVTQFRAHLYFRHRQREEGEPIYIATYGLGRVMPGDVEHLIDSAYVCNAYYDVTTNFPAGENLAEYYTVLGWSFRDNSGRGWLRRPDAELEPVTPDKFPPLHDWRTLEPDQPQPAAESEAAAET